MDHENYGINRYWARKTAARARFAADDDEGWFSLYVVDGTWEGGTRPCLTLHKQRFLIWRAPRGGNIVYVLEGLREQ